MIPRDDGDNDEEENDEIDCLFVRPGLLQLLLQPLALSLFKSRSGPNHVNRPCLRTDYNCVTMMSKS